MADKEPSSAGPLRSVAIILARGGSKRIPRKNIRSFRGRPIIGWSIAAAKESGLFDEVMVSTDDKEIADISVELGATVPFLRSAKTADDHATTPEALLEVLGKYHEIGRQFELACCLYPTAPFVRAADLVEGRRRLDEGGFDVIMPVARFHYPIWRSLKRDAAGTVALNFPENLNARSQDLPPAYHDAGQWYWFRTAALERDRVLMGPNSGSIILPSMQVQDIDEEEDWMMAEFKHRMVFG